MIALNVQTTPIFLDEQQITDDTEFLNMLHKFCHWDVTSNSGKIQLSEIDTWRLIMRRMDSK